MKYAKKISSPIGILYLTANEEALIALDNVLTVSFEKAIKTPTHKILNLAHKQLDEYFEGLRTSFDLPLEPQGTSFQHQAWRALMEIPFGSVWSYKEQAIFLNNPKACRAVGGANGKNPIPIIIPCHRVIGSNGSLTGYSGGMQMKIDLLKHESEIIQRK